MNKRKSFFILNIFGLVFILVTGCVSQKQCIKNSDFCGIVVDENNKPIPNYSIKCSKNLVNVKSTYTNNSGIFFIPNMETGKYTISGKKNNYIKIIDKEFYFNGSQSIFCCQVMGIKAVLDKILINIKNKDYEKALEILKQLELEKDELNYGLILLYEAYLYDKLKNKEDYEKCVNLIKNIKNNKFKELIEKGDGYL